ncbi:DUF1905 domain-containing protein [Microbacterium sp. ARD31]|uniref:DUF1905 domain-containing protein n=1 Tax=Microbacterium sp. ARD31 TaxID=2962576 RepID=UPI002880C943|nr:DUF1905 domain-containing protein [Microbacterium sp. ARD31]MDT0178656.1 DUF1905 domain-containing protein [Microbacterium sp. ARD31]
MIVEASGVLFRWESRRDDWYFIPLPAEVSADIREVPRPGRGFGSIPVGVTVGSSSWRTSIFPDAARGGYVLPLKRSVREREGISEGDTVSVRLDVQDG